MPASLDFLIKESYNWFAHSAQRQSEFKGILELVGFDNINVVTDEGDDENDDQVFTGATAVVGKKSLKLISPSTTRWLVMADCVEHILPKVILFFNDFDYLLISKVFALFTV